MPSPPTSPTRSPQSPPTRDRGGGEGLCRSTPTTYCACSSCHETRRYAELQLRYEAQRNENGRLVELLLAERLRRRAAEWRAADAEAHIALLRGDEAAWATAVRAKRESEAA